MTKKARIEALEREVAALQKRVTELESGRWYMPIAPIPPGEAVPYRIEGPFWTIDTAGTGTVLSDE